LKWFPEFRALALLRRIAKAIEESNRLAQARLECEHPEWARAAGVKRKPPKVVDFGVSTAEDFNEGWKRAHPEEEFAEES
jgi:hypothetical protein